MSKLQQVQINGLVEKVQSWNPSTENPDAKFQYVDISSIDRETKQIVEATSVLGREAPSRARQLVAAGDLLVSTVRPNLNAIAQVPDTLDGATASTGFCVLRPLQKVLESRYLYHWLRTPVFVDAMVLLSTGASYPAVTDAIIKSSTIPLPPLAEQKRIAAILDQADALRGKRRAALARLDALVQSLFLEMFGDPVANPHKWKVANLGDIAEFVGGGTPSREVPEYFEGNICWATSKDMKGEVLYDTEEHITWEAIDNSATKLLPAGNLLVVVKSKILMRRLPVLINKVETCFGQDLKGIIPKQGIPSRYIARHMRIGQRLLLQRARGVNTEGLTLEHLRNYPVMMPSEKLIDSFVQREYLVTSQIQKAEYELRRLEDLFHALQQRAFRGDL